MQRRAIPCETSTVGQLIGSESTSLQEIRPGSKNAECTTHARVGVVVKVHPGPPIYAPVAQWQEAGHLKRLQCWFESSQAHQQKDGKMAYGMIALGSLILLGVSLLSCVAAIPGSSNASTALKVVGTVSAVVVLVSFVSFVTFTGLFLLALI